MKKLSQKGFTAIEGLLILVIVAIVGGAGWFVLKSKDSANKTYDNSASSYGNPTKNPIDSFEKCKKAGNPIQESYPEVCNAGGKSFTNPKQQAEVDKTIDWTAFTSTLGKFSLRYPPDWVQPTNKNQCSAGLFDRALYLGPDKDSVLICGSEEFGQMSVFSVKGDKRSSYSLPKGDYKSISSKNVTADSVRGTRLSGVAYGKGEDPFKSLDGTVEVRYIFYTNGTTYSARHTQSPGSKNVLADFVLMITKTLKFN